MMIMKTFLLFLFFASALNACAQSDSLTKGFRKLQWLIGSWNGINSKAGISAKEEWRRSTNNSLTGTAFTLKDRDTLEIEHLSITVEGNNIYFVADVRENKAPVLFK